MTNRDPAGEVLEQLLRALSQLDRAPDDASRIDRIALLERLRSVVASAQATEMVEFCESQLAEQYASGTPRNAVGRGIADQIALARGLSPATGSQQLSYARSLVKQLPRTRELLESGDISESSAQAMVRETAELRREDRRRIDADLADDLATMTTRQTSTAARRLAYELDPESAVRRGRTARKDRRVSIRPAPDTMALITGYVPVEQGVAAWNSLDTFARARKAEGDERTRGQIMADAFIERITGQHTAYAVPVEIDLTVTPETLDGDDDAPADVSGYGPLPGELARDVIGESLHAQAPVYARALLTDPVHGVATHIGRRRRFTGSAAELIRKRDRRCRTPGCGAPIRHLDHIRPYRADGATTVANGQGLCERCSYVKEMPGWRTSAVGSSTPYASTITTPTGHTYSSRPPPTLGDGPTAETLRQRRVRRRLEYLQRERLIAALPRRSSR